MKLRNLCSLHGSNMIKYNQLINQANELKVENELINQANELDKQHIVQILNV